MVYITTYNERERLSKESKGDNDDEKKEKLKITESINQNKIPSSMYYKRKYN